ncbi:hypothetical protein SAMN06295987_104314 [Novosphingobium mathurense]|uniref:Uncharacterized protein n=1 Tax=Novosphingobium mathurense TaxID=428990 RepID=A0A1U6I7K6_9SPHN|nr:hypothetical protein SAMN06295987_104314 [Novosphingobium mathurense]
MTAAIVTGIALSWLSLATVAGIVIGKAIRGPEFEGE